MNGNKLIVFILVVSLLITGCAQSKIIHGVEYEPYGVINRKDERKFQVEYKRKRSSIILSILLFETVVVPFYLIGFRLYEPVKFKDGIKTEESKEK